MKKEDKLIKYLESKGGIASYEEISKAGFNKNLLKDILDSGKIQKLDRGLYKLSSGITLSDPDIVAVSIKASKGVICLLSALSFHGLTDQIPQKVEVAIPRGSYVNVIKYPPVHFYHFSKETWKTGIETYDRKGHKIKIYSIAKTIADCFKFRNKIGIDIARRCMKRAIKDENVNPNKILYYSKICRVDKIVKPLIETLL